jgi:DNA repair exonuclease SbcCD ATPase subunit
MKIKYLKIKNFLSVGEKPLEIDFTKYGNIVNIRGSNLDAGPGASNGAGKSTIIEGLVYGLYGKLIKGLSHKEAINIRSKKGLEVEVHWDNYKAIRKRAPDRLHLWEDDKEISLGGIPATDELMRSIIKLNYNSFINIACFGQHNNFAFLSCTALEKRQIAENLLSLEKYIAFNKTAKEKLKDLKDLIFQKSTFYQTSLQELTASQKKSTVVQDQRKQWRQSKIDEINSIEDKCYQLSMKIEEMRMSPEVADYESHQVELLTIQSDIDKKEKARVELHIILEKADNAIQQRRDDKHNLQVAISNADRGMLVAGDEIKRLEVFCKDTKSNLGSMCSKCYGEITESNIKKMMENAINDIKKYQIQWNTESKKKEDSKNQLNIVDANLNKLLEGRKLAREKETTNLSSLNDLISRKNKISSIRKPDKAAEIQLIEKDLHHYKEHLDKCKASLSEDPYVSMIKLVDDEIKTVNERVNVYKDEIKEMDSKVPYFNFWVKAFGDEGIRAFVIDEIIPALNARINYWLQFLMDGRVQVHFDNQLEETIKRSSNDVDPFVYNSLSGGEHCRIDLAISQAFAHVMMMTSGACPSIVALDEVGANIDRPGIQSLYKMICELARERQVLVITHDPDLLDLLSGYDTIDVVMKNGFTSIKE